MKPVSAHRGMALCARARAGVIGVLIFGVRFAAGNVGAISREARIHRASLRFKQRQSALYHEPFAC